MLFDSFCGLRLNSLCDCDVTDELGLFVRCTNFIDSTEHHPRQTIPRGEIDVRTQPST
jgi:hypothetical protein